MTTWLSADVIERKEDVDMQGCNTTSIPERGEVVTRERMCYPLIVPTARTLPILQSL